MTRIVFSCFVGLLLGLAPVAGQAETEDNIPFSLDLSGGHLFDSNLDDDRGGYSQTSAKISLTLALATLHYQYDHFSWSDLGRLPFGNGVDEPWQAFHNLGLDLAYGGMFNERWGYFLGAGAVARFESEIGGSLNGSGFGGLSYAFNDDWSVNLGVTGQIDAVEITPFPLVTLNYRLGRETGWSMALGVPQTTVRYGFSRALALELEGGYDYFLYRLAEDSAAFPEGYVRLQSAYAKLGLSYQLGGGFYVALAPEVRLMRRLTLYDDGADKIDGWDQDIAFGVLLSLGYRF